MKQILFLIAILSITATNYAQTFTVDGLEYEVTSTNPNEVTITGGTPATTDLVISPSVTDNGTTYSVTIIGELAFGLFDGEGNPAIITSVSIPNTVRIIENSAFSEKQLTGDLILPNSVIEIGSSAFSFNQITSVTLSENLNEIPFAAFSTNALTTLTIPSSVTTIANSAFTNNTITEVTALATLAPTIVTSSFSNVISATLNIPAGTLTSYINNGWGVFGTIVAGGVTFQSAFTVNDINYLVKGLQPNEVSVRGQAGALTTIDIPATVSNAGTTYNVVEIRNNAFQNNNITSLTLPSTLREIGNRAFLNNTITSLVIPNSVTAIGTSSFSNNSIATLTLGNSVTTIGINAFRFNQLTALVIPNTVVTLGSGVFADNNLSAVTLPNNLSTIPSNIFRNNPLTSISIPASVTSIENDAFFNNQLETLVIPDTVTSIGLGCFEDNNLTSLTIGSGLSVLNNDVFAGNQLTEITIPSTVTNVRLRAFRANPLTTVIVEATTPPNVITGSNDSFNNRGNIDLTVPEGTTQDYLAAGWTDFASIEEFEIDISVAPKVFLQGASLNPIAGEEDLMRDSLRSNGLLPTISPYGDGASVSPTVFTTTGPDAIVDWVLVELRTGVDNENTTVVTSQAAFIQRDGDIVGLDGTSSITFTEEDGDYFIAIKHRNHIGILTAVPAPLSGAISTLDFTQDAAFAKGENLALTEVNGTFAMIAGDADGSSQILNTDITEGLTLAGGGEGYSNADADMNGFVLNSDIQLLILGNSGTVQQFE